MVAIAEGCRAEALMDRAASFLRILGVVIERIGATATHKERSDFTTIFEYDVMVSGESILYIFVY